MSGRRKEHIFINDIELKECSKCKELKSLHLFRKDKGKWDGLYPYCKSCASVKDKKVYYKNPKKKMKVVKEYMKRTGEYYKYKPYNPKYYSSVESKKKKRARDLKRRTLKKNADIEYKITSQDIDNIINKYNGKCAYCGKPTLNNYHIDHKLPLSKGGGNEINNLALSCPTCNLSKNDKTDIEFIGRVV